VKSGATVRATGDGVVVFSSSRDDVSLVVIDHGTILTYYAYLSNLVVRTGQEVRRGDQIGEATAPHLHYEMRISSEEQNTKRSAIPLNPYRYLANASTFQLAHMPDSQK